MFVLAVFVASASWQVLVAGGGAFLGRVLTSSRGRFITAITSSILIGVMALHREFWHPRHPNNSSV